MTITEIRKAIDEWIDELDDMDIGNPLEPLKVASALKSELMAWEHREKAGQSHSPLDVTVIKALEYMLEKMESE